MIVNRQRGVRLSLRDLDEFAVLASRLLRLPSGSVTVCLVTNAEIARWNRDYRGKAGPTDVLSFPSEPTHLGRMSLERARRRAFKPNRHRAWLRAPRLGARARYLGDIAIAPLIAQRNALRLGRTCKHEIRILILHGMLHLLGYDHETDSGQMERRERRLRRRLGLE